MKIIAPTGKRKTLDPGHVFFTWDITYNCNYSCSYCFLNDEPENKNIKALSLSPENWEKIWHKIYKKYGSCHIAITGGEPFCYPDFMEIIGRINKFHVLEFNTNLSFDKDEFLNRINPARVSIGASFHKEYDEFDEFLENMIKLKQAGIKRYHISYVAFPPYLNKIREYKNKSDRAGIPFVVILYRGNYQGRKLPDAYTKEEIKYIENNTELCVNCGAGPLLVNEEVRLCRMGQMYSKILPDGSAWRCCLWSNRRDTTMGYVGQITDDDFSLLDNPEECKSAYPCSENMVVGEEEKWVNQWIF